MLRRKISLGQWLCAGMTVLALVLAVVVFLNDVVISQESEALIASHKQGVGQLTMEQAASQTFAARENGLMGLQVMASNYNKKVKTGTLTLWVTDASGKEVARADYAAADMKNNAFIALDMPVQPSSAGKQYTLHAVSDCTEQKGVTLRMGPVEESVGELILADGTVDAENAMNIRLNYESKTYSIMGGGELVLIALCFAACIPFAGRKERRNG